MSYRDPLLTMGGAETTDEKIECKYYVNELLFNVQNGINSDKTSLKPVPNFIVKLRWKLLRTICGASVNSIQVKQKQKENCQIKLLKTLLI